MGMMFWKFFYKHWPKFIGSVLGLRFFRRMMGESKTWVIVSCHPVNSITWTVAVYWTPGFNWPFMFRQEPMWRIGPDPGEGE